MEMKGRSFTVVLTPDEQTAIDRLDDVFETLDPAYSRYSQPQMVGYVEKIREARDGMLQIAVERSYRAHRTHLALAERLKERGWSPDSGYPCMSWSHKDGHVLYRDRPKTCEEGLSGWALLIAWKQDAAELSIDRIASVEEAIDAAEEAIEEEKHRA